MSEIIGASGRHQLEVYRGGELIKTLTLKNTIMLTALNDVLNVYLRNGTPKAAWYAGLIDNAGFTTLANADTMASHAGWSENQDYTESVRQTWTPAAASSQAVVNGTPFAFTMNATVSIRGVFIASSSVKGESASLLFSTAQFAEGVQTFHSTDVLKDTYTASLAPA